MGSILEDLKKAVQITDDELAAELGDGSNVEVRRSKGRPKKTDAAPKKVEDKDDDEDLLRNKFLITASNKRIKMILDDSRYKKDLEDAIKEIEASGVENEDLKLLKDALSNISNFQPNIWTQEVKEKIAESKEIEELSDSIKDLKKGKRDFKKSQDLSDVKRILRYIGNILDSPAEFDKKLTSYYRYREKKGIMNQEDIEDQFLEMEPWVMKKLEKIADYLMVPYKDIINKDIRNVKLQLDLYVKEIEEDFDDKIKSEKLKTMVAKNEIINDETMKIIQKDFDLTTDEGQSKAMELLTLSKAGYVTAIANKMGFTYNLSKSDIDDLIGAGMLILVEVFNDWKNEASRNNIISFDLMLGSKLSTGFNKYEFKDGARRVKVHVPGMHETALKIKGSGGIDPRVEATHRSNLKKEVAAFRLKNASYSALTDDQLTQLYLNLHPDDEDLGKEGKYMKKYGASMGSAISESDYQSDTPDDDQNFWDNPMLNWDNKYIRENFDEEAKYILKKFKDLSKLYADKGTPLFDKIDLYILLYMMRVKPVEKVSRGDYFTNEDLIASLKRDGEKISSASFSIRMAKIEYKLKQLASLNKGFKEFFELINMMRVNDELKNAFDKYQVEEIDKIDVILRRTPRN